MSVRYRPDIDALRFLAVMPVVLFHLNIGLFSGGYVGVDVFFVISGYLITGQIFREHGKFSILDFYVRRAKRILPALFVITLATFFVAAVIMLPVDFKRLSQSMVAVALFSANILFWLQSGYFDTASHMKPLLHTWSLGVEEQFYIVYPVLGLLLVKYVKSKRAILSVLALLLAASFTASVVFPGYERGDSFYLPHLRAWELLLGAVLAFAAPPVPENSGTKETISWFGVALILFPVFLYTADTTFPGLGAVPPCLGAALIIYARTENNNVMGRILHASAPVFIGRISYSLYLWHWPVIVLYRYYKIGDLNNYERIVLFALMIALSYLSWRFIEMPIRRYGGHWPRILAGAAASSAVLLVLGLGGHIENGFPGRFDRLTNQVSDAKASDYRICFLDKGQSFEEWDAGRCTYLSPVAGRQNVVLLWGDSHADHFTPGLTKLQEKLPMTLVKATFAGCPPIIDYAERDNPHCKDFNDGIMSVIRMQKPDFVLLVARWNAFRDPYYLSDRLSDTVEQIKQAGSIPIIIGETPSFAAPVPDIVFMLEERGRNPDWFSASDSFRADEAIEAAAKKLGAVYYSPRKDICHEGTCRIRQDGNILYRDESHLTDFGSLYLVNHMSGFLRQVLASRNSE